ncbi:hypothetical protein Tco_0183950 [Tanacetum coccineum]
MSVLPDDQMNSVINCLTAKSTWDELILYHKGPSNVKESRVMDLKLCYNTFKFKEGESLTQTFTRYKALINELVNEGINLSKLEINTGFINGLPQKWPSLCQSLRNINHVKDSKLASLFDSSDDEEDTRSSHEYLNDLEEKYQARALLDKSKRFFKKGTQRFSSEKATDQTECHKCGKKGHFSRDYWSKTSVPSYQSPFQLKSLSSPQHKLKLRPIKDFEAKYNKVKAKLALLSSSASASKASTMVEVKVLIALAEDNDAVAKKVPKMVNGDLVHELNACKEQLLVLKQAKLDFLTMQHINTEILKENKNLRTELKELSIITETWLNSSNKVNQYISEQIPSQKKRVLGVDQPTEDSSSSGQKDIVFVKSSADDTKVSILSVERPWLSKPEGFILPNHDTATEYDSADESSVCSTPLPPLKKLNGAEPTSGPKTIKSILRSKSTFKAETLKGAIINKPSSAPDKGNKNSSASVVNSAPAARINHLTPEVINHNRCEKTDHRTCDHAEYISTMNISQHLKSLGRASSISKISRPSKHFFPPCTHYGCIDHLSNECLYYPICGLCGSYDHDTNGHNRIISLEREINLRNPQHTFKRCEVYGSLTHTTTDHYDIEWFKRGEALQAKKVEALKSTRAESLNANRSKTPTKSGCSRHITGVKSYLHKYVEQPGPKVVFGDDSTCTTKGHGSIKCNGIVFIKFDEKRGTIFNPNKEIVMISPTIRDVYVLDMASSAQESCFFAKASENLN